MSKLTNTPILTAPAAADSLAVSPGLTEWVNGDWVEFIPFTSASDTAIAGVCITDAAASGWTSLQLEVAFGIGDEGNEVEIGHIRLHGPASGNGGPTQYLVPFPISGIPIATRVSIRYRSKSTGAFNWPCTLLYYEDLDSDQVIPYTVATLTSFPSGSDSINIVPNATPWADSAWFEFDPVIGVNSYVFGVAMANMIPGEADAEIEVGIGGAGTEVGLTDIRFGSWGLQEGRLNFATLPGMMPIPSGSRLVGRLRKSTTATDVQPVAYLGYVGPLETATLQVFKDTIPDGSTQEFEFSGPGLFPDPFTLTDGGVQQFLELTPGVYSVEEINIPAGWTLTSVVVSNGDDPSAITLEAGQTVTVLFTNTQAAAPASLIICKETVPGGSPQEFDFEAGPGLDPATFSLPDGECQTYEDITPGTYSAEEVNVPVGWTLTNVVVSNGDPNTAINIAEGETVTVTFTNEQSSECPGDRGAPPIGI